MILPLLNNTEHLCWSLQCIGNVHVILLWNTCSIFFQSTMDNCYVFLPNFVYWIKIMESCLDTIFQMGKYQFTSNSFLNLLSKKDVLCSEIPSWWHASRTMPYCYLAQMPAALSPLIMSIKDTVAQIFLLSQGLALNNCLSIFAHP